MIPAVFLVKRKLPVLVVFVSQERLSQTCEKQA